ncbi:MAG: translation initiation factor 2, partial [Rhodobacterales bacterium]|nr:translation initiation factor 2 [Rhodobacterales bacterium]
MKPNFALNLTEASIGLLHRTARGWVEIGSVALDDPDLAEALGYLRRSALGLDPRGLATKLILPNSQILYTQVEAPGPDAAARRAQIRAALDGLTPYAVDELAFDWRGTGATVQVAVVARETLDEAEAFAREHRFNPVSFVAIPGPGQFAAEPWFGQAAAAADLLAPGEKVERDQDPVQIVLREPPRTADPVAAAPDPVVAAPAAPEVRAPDRRAPRAAPTPEPAAAPAVEMVEPAFPPPQRRKAPRAEPAPPQRPA